MTEVPPSEVGTLEILGLILEKTLRKRGLGNIVLMSQMQRRWTTIAGALLAGVSQPEIIRGRVLFITVRDSVWLQNMTFYQALLLRNIRQNIQNVTFTKLHFTLARSSFRQPEPSVPAEVLVSVPLTAAEDQQVREGTRIIADPELREAVSRAWKQGWQARRSGL